MIDFFALAVRSTKEEFVAACPFFFLVGRQVLERPMSPRKTGVFEMADPMPPEDTSGNTRLAAVLAEMEGSETLVLPVRKVQEAFESMITVGRTNNHDIVIADVGVSRFHAFFRVHADRIELSDAGSANGTFVGESQLQPKGASQIVIPGDTLRFAHLAFSFLDAGACWDRLQGTEAEQP